MFIHFMFLFRYFQVFTPVPQQMRVHLERSHDRIVQELWIPGKILDEVGLTNSSSHVD